MSDPLCNEHYQQLLSQKIPIIDLRAPVEFAQGAFPGTVNLPLMDDRERALVGTCYKEQGRDKAICLGHQLVSGEVKAARLSAWRAFAEANPSAHLMCFRGGMRSQIVQQWLAAQGIALPRVIGGYKAMRQFALHCVELICGQQPLLLLSGYTGVGKTNLLHTLLAAVDLEGLANHRGSSFGGQLTEQPSQVTFENRLAMQMLALQAEGSAQWVIEDESKLVGRCSLPLPLLKKMKQAPIVMLTASLAERVDNIYQDYVLARFRQLTHLPSREADQQVAQYLLGALSAIKRRLGQDKFNRLALMINTAIASESEQTKARLHRAWIRQLLEQYYDPMYRYQIGKKQSRIRFSGNAEQVTAFFAAL